MSKTYAFGPFTLDAGHGALLRGSQPTALGPRAASLLLRLVEQPQQLVGKEALMEAAWPGLVVEESNLTVQIASLRKILSDAGGERWIETVPRRGYRYAGPPVVTGAAQPSVAESPANSTQKPKVAVLPFTNSSGDAEQAYLADGMVGEIVNGLSRVRWLFVIARSSTQKYREHASLDVKHVAQELGVRYVLQGSVSKSANRVRIACQLVDAHSSVQVWGERYDRPMADLFALQDEVALAVLGTIEPTLRQTEAKRVARQRPESLHAYELVLQAQADVFSGMPEPATRALELLDRVLSREPQYALAHAYAAMCHHNRFLRGGLLETDRDASIAHARAAMAHGRDDALALTFAGFSMGMDAHDRTAAFAAFDAALAISPSSALTYILGSVVLGWGGEALRAIEWGRQGLQLSPFDAWAFAAWHAIVLGEFKVGRLQEASDAAARAVQANPDHSISYMLQAAALCALGRVQDARKAANTVMELQPNFRFSRQLSGVNCETVLANALGAALKAVDLPE